MSTYSLRFAVVGTFGLLLGWSCAVAAQDLDAGLYYSQGVHAYFAGQSAQAERYLSAALAIDTHDPRPYYFRALSRLRLGKTVEARRDMERGAAQEALAPRRFAVGAALERVQGRDRLLLERYRREGRLAEANRRLQRDRARYEQLDEREQVVLHRQIMIPLDLLLAPGGSLPVVLVEPGLAPRSIGSLAGSTLSSASGGQSPAAMSGENPFEDDTPPPAQADAAAVPSAGSATPAAGQGVPQPVPRRNPFEELFSPRPVVRPTPPTRNEEAEEQGESTVPDEDPFRNFGF